MIEYNHHEEAALKKLCKGRNVFEVNPFLGEMTAKLKQIASNIAINDSFKFESWMKRYVAGDYEQDFKKQVGNYYFFDPVMHRNQIAARPPDVLILNRVRGVIQFCDMFDNVIKAMPIGGHIYAKEFHSTATMLFFQKHLFFKHRQSLRIVEEVQDGGVVFEKISDMDASPSIDTLWNDSTPPELITAYYAGTYVQKGPKLRVGFLSPGFGLGGAERWILALCRNFSVDVVVSVIVIESVNHVNHDLLGKLPRATRVLYGNEHIKDALDICDVCISWGSPFMLEHTKGHRTPVVAVAHGAAMDNDYSKNIMFAAQEAGVKHFAAVNEACRAVFPAGVCPRIIANGAEPERVVPTLSASSARERLGVADGERLLLYAGRIMPDKMVAKLPHVAKELGEGWQLRMVGTMAYFSDSELARWEAVTGNFRIMKPVHQIGDLLVAADVAILLSKSEAHPMSMTEAWMVGCPTVTTKLPWIDSLEARFGELTWLVDVDASVRTIADQVRNACNSDSRVSNAQYIAFNILNAPRMACAWESYLREVAGA